jgi:tight adherence protein C
LTLITLGALAVALVFWILAGFREAALQNRLAKVLADPNRQAKELGPLQSVLSVLAQPLAGAKERERLSFRLTAAGLNKPWALSAFLVAKLAIFIVVFAAVWAWLDINLNDLTASPLKCLQLLFFVFLGARLPDWWLSGKVKERSARIKASVPQALDLLTICVESGLGLEESFERVARETATRSPEVSAEFKTTMLEMAVMDRLLALKRLEKRNAVRELGVMANSLLQSIQYGTPLSNALQSIATECRAKQISELEEKAGAISAKVGIPLVLLILFPLVAIIAAPAVISLIRTFNNF